MEMSLQRLQWPVASSTSSSPSCRHVQIRGGLMTVFHHQSLNCELKRGEGFISAAPKLHFLPRARRQRRWSVRPVLAGGAEDTEVVEGNQAAGDEVESESELEPTPDDMENIGQIKRALELLKKNRDMLFGEDVRNYVPVEQNVKLTIMIEDPRDVERRRLLGIDDPDTPTRDDLAEALEDVNEGRFPKNRVALKMLAEEMINWPNLEVELPKMKSKSKSPYAKATDTGVDPQVAAKRLNMDWDTAAEIEEDEAPDETEVPSILGYGALYLVSAFPIIIGVSVVLILFYNSLQ